LHYFVRAANNMAFRQHPDFIHSLLMLNLRFISIGFLHHVGN